MQKRMDLFRKGEKMTAEETVLEFSLSEPEQAELETVLTPLNLTIQEVAERFFQYVARTGKLPSTLEEVSE